MTVTDNGVDPALLADLAAAVRAEDGVTDAVAVVRREARVTRAAKPRAAKPAEHRSTVDSDGLSPAEAFGGDYAPRPGDPATLQEALKLAAELVPDKGVAYIAANGGEEFQSYPRLLAEAQRALTGLRDLGLQPGDPVLFQFGDNRNFLVAFWACVLGGLLPTPVGTPLGYDRDNAVTRKLFNSWELLDRPLILTDQRLLAAARGLSVLWDVEDLRIEALEPLLGNEESTDWFPATPDDPALHLLTSGSTGVPKCVRHLNRSIVARSVGDAMANDFTADDVALNWMPLDHVGGIVMFHVSAVVLRQKYVNAEIEAFLAEPASWMEWTHRHRATRTWAPNFAFALFNEHADSAAGRDWDLSCLRYVLNGGEAVVSRTAQRFGQILQPYGLPADAIRPAYGMSETSSGIVSSALSSVDPTMGTLRFRKDSMSGRLRPAVDDDQDTVTFTEVGRPQPGVRLRIVDHEDRVLPEDHIGRLQAAGPTIMTGYHRNPDANAASFTADGWFTTGDLAFLHDGRLSITGRENDLIIIQGANFLSYDIESIVEQVDGAEVTFVAACAYAESDGDTDQLVVFFVPSSDRPAEQRATVNQIKATLSEQIGLQPRHAIPVPRESFPKTASGKIQRSQLVKDLKAGEFDDVISELDGGHEPEGALPNWFFDKAWLSTEDASGEPPAGPWLVLAPDGAEIDDPEIVVANAENFTRLLEERQPTVVVHALGLHHSGGSLDITVHSVRSAVKTLTGQRFLVLTANGVWARPGDELDVAKATLPGLIRTAAAERVAPLVRLVDVDTDDIASVIRTELKSPATADLVAYRDGQRLTPKLRPVALGDERPAAIEPSGLYLITGGLGGIAREIAQYLLAAYQVKLLLVGRSEVDADDERLQDLQILGDVEYHALDVADATALGAAVAAAEERHGPLAGVLHLASADVSGQWSELERHKMIIESRQAFDDNYRAKVLGTLAIAEVLTERPDALLVLFSSVNGDFGGSSFGAYSSANSFLNGFADHWGRQLGRPVRCLAWSMWSDAGMNQGAPADAAKARGFRAITAEQGLESLLVALAAEHVHLLVGLDGSNEHIVAELAADQSRTSEIVLAYTGDAKPGLPDAAHRSPVPVRLVAVPEIPRVDGEIDQAQLLAAATVARQDNYVAPATDLERQLAQLWAEVLGRPRIGRDDRFFDLGGSSLRAAQLVARTNSALDASLLVHQLYEHPTVGELATVLAKELKG
ncbi:SDR family NAD(P)-dependent oxidoreductase [Kutzneria sp. NPDC052558]|uniref:SDR family NAD(P)-dependent oxidoreductase n=1 Tax=Kutzneria sp. NPDC052558 TaxID=3364121 RepID=UPI0037C634FF